MTNHSIDNLPTESPTYRGRSCNGFTQVWCDNGNKSDLVPLKSLVMPAQLVIGDDVRLRFDWGYGGCAPAQLALTLLIDALGDKDIALDRYQEFKRRYVVNWGHEWRISASEIRDFAASRPRIPKALFALGEVLITPDARQHVGKIELICGLQNHLDGDWGGVDRDTWKENCEALDHGRAIVSRYNCLRGGQFIVVTEADRSFTTIMLRDS